MNEKDLNLRRREREAKVPVALWAASGPSRPEDERRQRGRRRRQPASGAKQAVKSFPRNQTKKTAPKGCCFFRLNMNEKDLNLRRRERESKVPVALWVASGPSRPEGGTKAERAAEETACERSEAGGQVLSPEATAIRRRFRLSAIFLLRKILTVLGKKTIM